MPAQITFYSNLDQSAELEKLHLGEVQEPEDGIAYGMPVQVFGKNSGDTNLREISVYIEGEGKLNVQLARDESGQSGVWADAGQSIILNKGTVFSGESFSFWARGLYHANDAEGTKPMSIIFNAVSVS